MKEKPRSAHPVLAASDVYADWLREGQVLAERRDSLATQVTEARRADEEGERQQEAAIRRAVEAGEPIPKPPKRADWSHLDAAQAIQRAAEMEHRERREAVLAEAGRTGVLDALTERERSRMGRLGPLVEALRDEVREAAADAQVCRDIVQATDLLAGVTRHPSRAERITSQPSVLDVIEAVQAGESLLEPRPLSAVMGTGLGMKIERVGPNDEATRIGPLPGPGFGNVDRWPRLDPHSSRGVQL